MALAEVFVGGGAAVLLGRSALPKGRGLAAPALAEDLALGLALVVPLAFAWGLAGLPWSPVSMPLLALALAALLRVSARRGNASVAAVPAPPGWAGRVGLALLAVCFAAAAWKWLRAPLWSWDHFAVWGNKTRRLVPDGVLDLEFLKVTKFLAGHPEYPIGLPVAWRFLSPSIPAEREFRLCHALFAGGLVAALYGCARRLRAPTSVAALAAAALCASPLFWDTEAVGLADLPLACVATTGVLLLLEARDDPGFPAWAAGAAFGFLAWIKTEGLVLGALLAVLAALAGPALRETRQRRTALLAAWLGWSGAALAVRHLWLSPGVEFLTGDWTGRIAERARNPAPIFDLMRANLTGAEWFGLWFLFAAAALSAIVLRKPRFLCLVVLGQLAFYTFVYFGTFLSPADHIQTSFHRLAAALAPLALLGVVAAVGAPSEKRDGLARP